MSQFEVGSGMKLEGISREGGIGAGGGMQCVKGRAGLFKEKGGAMQMRRVMMGRAARAKVWEERIEEEGEEENERRLREEVMGEQGSGCNAKTNEEIGVFDAERYFGGGSEQAQAGWVREEEEELMEGEAGGDLPLSPLVEFGKGKSWRDAGGSVREARGWVAASFGQRRAESSEFTSPRTSTASSLSEVEPPFQQRRTPISQPAGKPKSKLQPASPSSRLANFLAKFKPPTPRKSPSSSPILHLMSASTPPPPLRPPPLSVLSPAKKLLPNSLLVSPHGKAPSPRGRFLRAFSNSSSADHTSSTSLRHHATVVATPSSMAASSPVSPAAHSAPPDPYSPIIHSASTTPTSARIPRRSPHSSSLPSQPYNSNLSSYSKPGSTTASRCTSSGSLKQQLPFLSRKLKVYLMPDKAGTDHSSRQGILAKAQLDKAKTGSIAGQQGDLLRLQKHAPEEKQRQRWLHAEDQVVDEDIELAERLLRVVQDHQSSSNHYAGRSNRPLTSNHATNISKAGLAVNHQHKSSYNVQGFADRVSEYSSRKYDQMHPTVTTTSNLTISPHGARSAHMQTAAAPTQSRHIDLMSMSGLQPTKEESSLYDSDSSSDLFEIEALASVGMGLYRRDLPVYEAKEHMRSNHSFTFVSSRPSTAVCLYAIMRACTFLVEL